MNKPAHSASFEAAYPARFTTAEFLRMIESGALDDIKIELIDGELQRMNPPMNMHSARQAAMVFRLAQALGDNGIERVRGELGIVLGDDTVVGCDAAVLIAPTRDHRLLAPDEVLLVVEIAETTATRDLVMKRKKYAKAGIPHYWVVEGAKARTHVFSCPESADYSDRATVSFGELLPVPGTDATIVID